MSEYPPVRIFLALGFALLITILLFSILPMLVIGTPEVGEITEPMAVNLIRIRDKEPPPPEEKEEPDEKPPPERPEQIRPDLSPPSFRRLAMDAFGLRVDASLISGPIVGIDLVYDASQVDEIPMPLVPINPIYPYQAQRFSITGYVRVGFVVDEGGRVKDMEIIESMPEDVFDESVRRALMRAKFRPGVVEGEPVPTRVVQTIRFDLE